MSVAITRYDLGDQPEIRAFLKVVYWMHANIEQNRHAPEEGINAMMQMTQALLDQACEMARRALDIGDEMRLATGMDDDGTPYLLALEPEVEA